MFILFILNYKIEWIIEGEVVKAETHNPPRGRELERKKERKKERKGAKTERRRKQSISKRQCFLESTSYHIKKVVKRGTQKYKMQKLH